MALREMAEVADRSESSNRVAMEALDALRQTGASGQHEVSGLRVTLAGSDPSSSGAAAAATGVASESAGDPAKSSSRARAFVTRLDVLTEVRQSLGVSSSAAIRRVAALLRSSGDLVAEEQARYPQAVSAASGRALNEIKQVLQRGAEEIREASQHTENAVSAHLSGKEAESRAVSAEATGAVLRLRDRLMRGEGFRRLDQQLRAQGGGGAAPAPRMAASFAALPDQAASLPQHLAALSTAASVEVVRREAECALLAFDHMVSKSAEGGGGGGGEVPRELLDQITNPERRREFAEMPASRAAVLLQQTRDTLRNAHHVPDTMRRLRVVERILEIRSQPGNAGNSMQWGSERPHTIEVRRGLSRLAETASLASRIMREKEAESSRRVEEMRAALRNVAVQMASRTSAAVDGHMGRWKRDLEAAYARSQAVVLERAQELADVVVGALELCVADAGGSGGGSGMVAAQEDAEEEADFGPVSAWRSGGDGYTSFGPPPVASRAAPGPSPQELRRAHGLILDGFLAWVAYARAVLLSNSKGTLRAAAVLRTSLDKPRAEFDGLVRGLKPLPPR